MYTLHLKPKRMKGMKATTTATRRKNNKKKWSTFIEKSITHDTYLSYCNEQQWTKNNETKSFLLQMECLFNSNQLSLDINFIAIHIHSLLLTLFIIFTVKFFAFYFIRIWFNNQTKSRIKSYETWKLAQEKWYNLCVFFCLPFLYSYQYKQMLTFQSNFTSLGMNAQAQHTTVQWMKTITIEVHSVDANKPNKKLTSYYWLRILHQTHTLDNKTEFSLGDQRTPHWLMCAE